MDDVEELIARMVRAAGGIVYGRIRLQKEFYLLDQLGMGSPFSYSYHHYGPYSENLADAVDGAKAFKYVAEEMRPRLSDGLPFSVYCLGESSPKGDEPLGQLTFAQAQQALNLMQRRSATVLELAATIHWLISAEKVVDWRAELIRRKGVKTEMGRIDEAVAALGELGLGSDIH